MNTAGPAVDRVRDSLSELERLVPGLSVEVLPEFSGRLEALRVTALVRALGATTATTDPQGTLLSVAAAAQRLDTTPDWLYRHADQLPFTVRLGPRQLRFASTGIDEYIRRRAGR